LALGRACLAMRYLSVCSGIEAASVAWEPLGWKPVAFSEIAQFPCSVLSERYPHVPNFGDMTKFEEWDIEPGSIDILVGGTPCQSFSIAGLRGGLEDQRGNLALTYCRILQKFKPRWFVFENVPGVLSSNKGRDFGSILGAMAELGYGCCWSVRDAQYFGVPQRRRRVFVVGCLNDWRRAAEVLFEPGCVSGDSKKGRDKKKNIAGSLASRTTAGGGLGTDFDLDGGLQVVGTIKSTHSNNGEASHIVAAITSRPYSDSAAKESKLVVAFSGRNRGDDGRGYDRPPNVTGDIAGTVDTVKPGCVAGPTIGVRRLTPLECEKLQGFPPGWTAVTHRGKPAADSPRYKAIGNSMAVPVMRWIGERLLKGKFL